VFDIWEIARKLDDRAPGRVKFDLRVSGPDLDLLRDRHCELQASGSRLDSRLG